MRHLPHWTRADNLDLPSRAKSAWQISRITAEEARAILDYACWPNKKRPSGAEPIEVSEDNVTVFELVGAMQVANNRRGRTLKEKEANTLRKMVKKALRGKIVCDGKLDELYQSLTI